MDKENQPLIRSFSENNLYSPRDYEKAKRAGDLLNASGAVEIINELTRDFPFWNSAKIRENLSDPNNQIFISIEANNRVLIINGRRSADNEIILRGENSRKAIGYSSDILSFGWFNNLEGVYTTENGYKEFKYKNRPDTDVLCVYRQYSDGRPIYYRTSEMKTENTLSEWMKNQVVIATASDSKIKKPSEKENIRTMLLHPILTLEAFNLLPNQTRLFFEENQPKNFPFSLIPRLLKK